MQDAVVKTIRADMTNCYLIAWGQRSIIVDTGTYRFWRRRFLEAASIATDADMGISAIFITHGHFDHIGSAYGLSKASGAPIFIHEADYRLLKEEGRVPALPQGPWARFVMKLSPFMMAPRFPEDFVAEGVFGDGGADLHGMGLPARIIHTPGHTPGSSALVLDDGRAFVGDMAMSGFPSLSLKPDLPVIGHDAKLNIQSWRKLLDNTDAFIFHPGHGRPFTRDEAEAMLSYGALIGDRRGCECK